MSFEFFWNFLCISIVCAGAKLDKSRVDGKKQFKIIQDPQYRRFGSSVDLHLALEIFVPNGSVCCKAAVAFPSGVTKKVLILLLHVQILVMLQPSVDRSLREQNWPGTEGTWHILSPSSVTSTLASQGRLWSYAYRWRGLRCSLKHVMPFFLSGWWLLCNGRVVWRVEIGHDKIMKKKKSSTIVSHPSIAKSSLLGPWRRPLILDCSIV